MSERPPEGKDGALEAQEAEVRQPYVVPRHRLVIAVWLTVLALPILVIDNIPRTEARADQVKAVAAAPSTSSTTVPPTTAPPPTDPVTTEAAAPSIPVPQVVKVKATPTTAAPTTTATTQPPAPANEESGGASWYDYNPGECAHKTLPKGTVVTITNLANGATATCTVTDRGPYAAGRIIDLDKGVFAQLADPAEGTIQVSITW
jgi:rare lipoprotein A